MISPLYRILFFCLSLHLCCVAVQSYAPVKVDPVLEPWRWRYEEALDGLSVLCMTEAEDGTLWFGNVGSIARYDGLDVEKVEFDQTFLSMITHEKEFPWAKAIAALPDGGVLVLVGESLVLWSDGVWKVILPDVGPSVYTAQLQQAADGTIWLLVPDALWRLSPDLKQSSIMMKSRPGGQMESFSIDDPGGLWVLEKTENLKARLVQIPLSGGVPEKQSEWKEFPVPFENNGTEARIAAGRDGIIWYADSSPRSGLEAFDVKTGQWVPCVTLELPSQRYRSLLRRLDGTVLGGLNGCFVSAVSPVRARVYSNEQLLLPDVALSLFETADQRLWVIGRIGYVYSADLNDREWLTFEGLNYQCESEDGCQWFIAKSPERIVRHNPEPGQWFRYTNDDGLLEKPHVVMQSQDGLIWAAGRHDGRAAVSIYDGDRWQMTCFPEFAHWIEPKAFMEADDGTVLAGAGGAYIGGHAGGVLQLRVDAQNNVTVVKHHAPPDTPYYVTAISQAADKRFWLGSTIIHQYDGTAPAEPKPGLPGENTVAMAQDHDQSLWVAKEHAGVGRWTGSGWELFTPENGLASRRLSDLLVLQDGSLLVSSDKGISRFDGKRWVPQVYPEWFGMTSRWSGMKQAKDGSIWLSYGWLEVQTTRMKVNQTDAYRTIRHRPETDPPDTQIVKGLARVSPPGNTHIAWKGVDRWSRTPAKDLRFSWRIDGGKWSPFTPDTGHTFLNLTSGEHVIEVRARDLAFNVDPTPAQIEFTVIPPVWRQGWFVSLISFLTGLILFFLWRWIQVREQRLREQQEQREAFMLRQRKEREAELRGELVSLHEELGRLEEELRQTRKPFVQPEDTDNESDRIFLERVMKVLEEKYSDWEFGLEDLAGAMNISLRTLHRQLKSASGYTPKQLLREFRLVRAAELLVHTSLSITDIAFQTGHDDSGNFARLFKNQYHVTPTQYRTENAPES